MTVKAWLYDASMGRSEETPFQLSDTIFHGDKISVDAQDFFTHLFVHTSLCAFFSSCCLCFGSVRVGGERDV